MEQITLSIIPKGIPPVCHASQYDEGRVIRLNLMDGLQGYTLSDETIELDVRKPDGHIVTSSVTVVSGKTYVDITTTEQMCAVVGDNICELKISKSGVEIGTLNFKMQVEKSVLEGGDPSESFVYDLNEQIAEAVAGQYSGDVIFDDEPTAEHGSPYAVTSEGVKSAIENINIGDLHDVTITSPAQGEALVFDQDGNVVNGTVSTVGSLDDLDDVDTTGKVENSSVVWNGTDEFVAKKLTVSLTQAEYDALALSGDLVEGTTYIITDGQNVTCDLDDLNDVSVSGASSGQVLAFDGNDWVPLGVDTDSVTAGTNVTMLRSTVAKFGFIKELSCVYQLSTTGLSTIGTLPNGYEPKHNIDFTVNADNGANMRLRIQANSNNISISNGYGTQTGTYFSFVICYI